MSVRCIKGKLAKGFYVRNGGTITASGYIAGKGALRVGDYEMVIMIDAYDPKTNEKAIVNAQAMTTIHIVDR